MVYLQSKLYSLRQQLVSKWVLHDDKYRRQIVLSDLNFTSLSSGRSIIPYDSSRGLL